jgi:hypothetical protein
MIVVPAAAGTKGCFAVTIVLLVIATILTKAGLIAGIGLAVIWLLWRLWRRSLGRKSLMAGLILIGGLTYALLVTA